MIVELLDFNLPVDTVLRSMLNGNGEISAIVEASEFRGWNEPLVECTSLGLLRSWPLFGLVQADNLASKTFSLLKGSCIMLLIIIFILTNSLGRDAKLVNSEISSNVLCTCVSS